MPKDCNLSIYNDDSVGKVAAALDSKVRRKILNMVAHGNLSISKIALKLNMSLSTLSTHIKLLAEASLISVVQNTSKRGVEKQVSRGINRIIIDLTPQESPSNMSAIYNIPLGSFTDCSVRAACGMADSKGMVITDDTPAAFYSPERLNAQLLWFSNGFIEYRIPNYILKNKSLKSILISCELCSECPDYNPEWRSDITFWVNGVELCTYECPGDMGGRQGKFTPKSWSLLASQFGFLKNILVNGEGTYLDQQRVDASKIERLGLSEGDSIRLKIGIKETAKYIGGVNLFGEQFGDYPQGLMVKIDWSN